MQTRLPAPYHAGNNIQGFDGNLNADTGPDLNDPRVRERHAACVRKMVDTVNDLDNVLYEVMNDSENRDWDWWVVNMVQAYQKQQKPKQHPVGITGHGGVLTTLLGAVMAAHAAAADALRK